MRKKENYEGSNCKNIKLEHPACKSCHYFEPLLNDPEGGYCFLRRKLLLEGDIDFKKFNDKCNYFEKREEGGFLNSLGEDMGMYEAEVIQL